MNRIASTLEETNTLVFCHGNLNRRNKSNTEQREWIVESSMGCYTKNIQDQELLHHILDSLPSDGSIRYQSYDIDSSTEPNGIIDLTNLT